MRWFSITAATILLVLCIGNLAHADAFDPHRVPADSIWVLHIDADGVLAGKTWDIIDQKISHVPGVQSKIGEIQQITGVDFPKGLHDVTLWGSEVGDEAAVVMFHADFNKDRLLGVLSLAQDHAVNNYRDYEIHSWSDHEKHMFGAIAPNGLVIIARSEKNVQKALDVLDGNVESIKPDAARNAGNKAGVLIYAAAQKVADLKAKNPLFGQIDTAWASISQDQDNLVLQIIVTAKTAEAAAQMRSTVEGIKGVVALATNGNENADPKTKLAAKLLKAMTAKADGTSVTATIPIALDVVRDLVENGLPRDNPARDNAGSTKVPGEDKK